MIRPTVFLIVVVALAACGPGLSAPADLSLLWTFGGKSCAAAGVATVHVTIPGEVERNVPCVFGGVEGVKLTDFAPGSYFVALDAFDAAGNETYSDSANVIVRSGSENVNAVDLMTTAQAQVELRWSFAGLSCAEAQVDQVRVDFGGGPVTVVCHGTGLDGGDFTTAPGAFTAHVAGLRGGSVVYNGAVNVNAPANANSTYTVDLAGTVSGALEFDWTFGGKACVAAAVEKVSFRLSRVNADGTRTLSDAQTFNCGDLGARYNALDAGRYAVDAQGIATSGATSFSGSFLLPVAAGVSLKSAIDLQAGAGH